MKKKFIYLLIILPLILLATIPAAYAWQTGGQAGSGGSSGGGTNILTDGGKKFDSGAYLFEVVYRPQNSNNREVLGCAVVYSGHSRGPVGDVATKSRGASGANDCKYVSSGALQGLAEQLYYGNHLDYLPIITEREVATEYLKQFGLDIKDMNKRGSEPGNIDSYGYRILIQKLTCFGVSGNWCKVLYPRKAFANDYPNNLLFGASYQNDLYTTVDDIGIKKSAYTSWHATRGYCYNDGLCSQLGRNFAYYDKGEGYNIIGFSPDIFGNYDYSIDAACENCEDNNKDGSYLIQDTTNWKAILASKNSKMDNVKNYYQKKVGNCEVLCREEYRITFPNANNKINAEAGRFFTLNKLGGAMYADGIPNMRQVKVTKVRECRAVGDNQKGCLTSFSSAAKGITGNSAGKTGTIKVKYDEKKYFKDSKYNTTVELEENKNRTISKEEYINNTVGESNVMLKSTVTKYFELPDEIYRWVNIRDGQSSLKKPNKDIIEHFLDMETPNFPISHGNYSKSSKVQTGADLTFNYSLPNPLEDPYTLISKAFNSKNDYFLDPTVKPTDNLYKKAKDGKLNQEEQEEIQQSACAKLFGFGTSKYNKCINDRTVNKAGNCYTQVTVDGKYKCNIGVCPEEGCPSQCQIIGDTYYGKDGKQVSQNEYAKQCGCMIIGGKYYGQKGTEVTKEEYLVECPQICRIENGKYYGKKGQIVSKEQYEAECPNKCAENCEAGYCCPDLDMVCPTKDENGMWSCPGRGKKIIYRPIDLANPFPGQTNYNRATGNNWCAYNVKTGKMNCKSTNGVATTHIQQNRSKDDENLYRQTTPLYEVDLDPTIIKNIRKYNKGKDYDDFTLNCNTKLKEAKSEHSSDTVCYSTFLREGKTGLNITGECARLGNLATCAESRG